MPPGTERVLVAVGTDADPDSGTVTVDDTKGRPENPQGRFYTA